MSELTLPARTLDAEDAFVVAWSESDDTKGLMHVIGLAIAERRPKLAADLAFLLDDHVEVPPGSPIDKARKAARFLVMSKGPSANPDVWADIDAAWREATSRQFHKARRRIRSRMNEGRPDPWKRRKR